MTPRLTKSGRIADAQYRIRSAGYQFRLGSSRPSPAERLRQRRKARAAVIRSLDRRDEAKRCRECDGTRIVNTFTLSPTSQGEHGEMEYWPGPCPICATILPQSRGTTTGQLVAMHLEAESDNDR